jgi:microcystin-dependent protein
MGKLVLDYSVPHNYDKAAFTNIVRTICNQVNQISEGKITGHYQSQATVPSGTAVAYEVSDFIRDSNATVTSGAVRLGWISTAAGKPGTLQEVWASTALPPAGLGPLPYSGSTIPSGWLECDGTAVSRTTYARLFSAISTTWGAGDGSTTFNLPDMRGKTAIGAGTGTVTASGVNADVDTGTDSLTVTSNNTKWITGMQVTFTLASGTITGLTSGNTYYVVRSSATAVKLASSLANAQNGTVIDLTAKSSPVWSITHTYTARTLGEYGGEQSHAMTSTELVSHQHFVYADGGGAAGSGIQGTSDGGAYGGRSTNATGGNAAMNIMQPFAATKFIISY